jgi:hypothetical protein
MDDFIVLYLEVSQVSGTWRSKLGAYMLWQCDVYKGN